MKRGPSIRKITHRLVKDGAVVAEIGLGNSSVAVRINGETVRSHSFLAVADVTMGRVDNLIAYCFGNAKADELFDAKLEEVVVQNQTPFHGPCWRHFLQH